MPVGRDFLLNGRRQKSSRKLFLLTIKLFLLLLAYCHNNIVPSSLWALRVSSKWCVSSMLPWNTDFQHVRWVLSQSALCLLLSLNLYARLPNQCAPSPDLTKFTSHMLHHAHNLQTIKSTSLGLYQYTLITVNEKSLLLPGWGTLQWHGCSLTNSD